MDSANPVTGQQGRPAVPAAPGEAWRGASAPAMVPAARSPRVPRDRIWFRRAVLGLLRDPVSRGFWRQGGYAVAGLLLAVPGFVFVVAVVSVGLGLSLSFAGMLVGLPLLVVALLGAGRLGAVHRRRVRSAGCGRC